MSVAQVRALGGMSGCPALHIGTRRGYQRLRWPLEETLAWLERRNERPATVLARHAAPRTAQRADLLARLTATGQRVRAERRAR